MIRTTFGTRTRPDALSNQTRSAPARKSPIRLIYLLLLLGLLFYLASILIGPYLMLQAGGLVVRDRFTAASAYVASVVAVHVKRGDRVEIGQPLLTIEAPDALDTAARLTNQRNALIARRLEVSARLATIEKLLPIAHQRTERAEADFEAIGSLTSRGLTTLRVRTEAGRERYEAKREEVTLTTEAQALSEEMESLNKAIKDIDAASNQLRRAYGDGVIRSPVTGIVASRTPSRGSVIRAGEPMVEILHGEPFVLAYVPTGRLYSLYEGMPVYVSDGAWQTQGFVELVEAVADQLPPEFQSTFSPRERQQIIRISLPDDRAAFPVLSKVAVSRFPGPGSLFNAALTGLLDALFDRDADGAPRH